VRPASDFNDLAVAIEMIVDDVRVRNEVAAIAIEQLARDPESCVCENSNSTCLSGATSTQKWPFLQRSGAVRARPWRRCTGTAIGTHQSSLPE
jgi:hypothetical protein